MSSNNLKKSAVIAIYLAVFLANFFIFTPQVKSLENPHYFYGYVYYQNDTKVPAGTVVTLTDYNNSNYMTTTTIDLGNGVTNYYLADVSQITGSQDGDLIILNCSVNGEVGCNSTNINISLGSQQVDLHLETQSLSISVSPSQWNQGSLNIGSSNNTTGGYFNLSNNGNTEVDVLIHGENITWDGNTWYLSSSADLDHFVLQYRKTVDSVWTNIGTTNSTFISNLKPAYSWYTNWTRFDLKIILPTSSSKDPPQIGFNITFWAIVS